MSRVAPRVGVFAGAFSVFLLLSLLLNSWLGVFPAVISGVVPMKFHLHYYIANLLGLEFSSAAYSESGVITLQENVQLILLPIVLMATRMGLRKRPEFQMPKTASLSEQAEAMEAGTVARVESEKLTGGIKILFSRIILFGTLLLFIFNSMLGIFPGILFNQSGMKIHPLYAFARLIGMDPSGPTWSNAAMLSAQEIIMIWVMVFIIPIAFSLRPKPVQSSEPSAELPPVGRSNDRVINPLAAEVIASVLGEAQRVDSEIVESALDEMDKIVESGINPTLSGVMADLDEEQTEDVEEESIEPEFVLEGPKEEAKLHLDKDDVQAIEKEVEEHIIPDASTLLGIDTSSQSHAESTPSLEEMTSESNLNQEDIQEDEEEESEDLQEDEDESDDLQEDESDDLQEDEVSEEKEIENVSKSTPTISGEMSVRPTSLPATAELDPKTGRWMINGVPVGPKVTSTGLDSDSNNRRIGGEDPLKESKKKEEKTSQNAERRGEKRGEKIETTESETPPPKRTKDGQKEHEPLPDMPEMTGRPNAERPKERKDDVELPDMPKF